MKHDIFAAMVDRWPSSVVARREVAKFSGGLVQPKTLANADSAGRGVATRVEILGRVGYPAEALAEWLRSRSKKA